MARHEFSAAVRRQIAERAGHQCSFPACNRRTVGGSADGRHVSRSGYAAHVYSASSNGPRGQGGLSPEELRSADNGIWLCGVHAKLVDNHEGSEYPPEVLHSYKALHEARVALEHEGLYPPVGWLHEFTVGQNPLFVPNQRFQFAKLNLFYGMNGTGKTALTEWITGFFDATRYSRWMKSRAVPIQAAMSVLNPRLQRLSVVVTQNDAAYEIDGIPCAFVPLGFNVIQLRLLPLGRDHVEWLSQVLGLPKAVIRGLAQEVARAPGARISNLRFERDPGDDQKEVLRLDVKGAHPGLMLNGLSGGEEATVVLELAIAAARLSGRYCPTLLVLEGRPVNILGSFFENYSRHLLDPENQFQTLMSLPERDMNLGEVRWNGWQVIHTQGQRPGLRFTQNAAGY